MDNQEQDSLLNQLAISKYLFHLQAESSLRLPPYKGSTRLSKSRDTKEQYMQLIL
jgi:hypothetical protein